MQQGQRSRWAGADRLSRKEFRSQNVTTKKAAGQHRRDIAALKRQVSALERAGLNSIADGQKISYELESGRDGRTSAGSITLLR